MKMDDVAHRVAVPLTPRSVTQISEIMHGLDLVDPGVVPPHRWRPQSPVSAEVAAEDELIAGVWRRSATYRPDPAA